MTGIVKILSRTVCTFLTLLKFKNYAHQNFIKLQVVEKTVLLSLWLALKIRVSAVRFCPRPPSIRLSTWLPLKTTKVSTLVVFFRLGATWQEVAWILAMAVFAVQYELCDPSIWEERGCCIVSCPNECDWNWRSGIYACASPIW
jgi:hypothetical protein